MNKIKQIRLAPVLLLVLLSVFFILAGCANKSAEIAYQEVEYGKELSEDFAKNHNMENDELVRKEATEKLEGEMMPRMQMGEIPDELLEICSDSEEGDSCQITLRDNEEVNGICTLQEENLLCIPEGKNEDMQRIRPQREK